MDARPVYVIASDLIGAAAFKSVLSAVVSDEAAIKRLEELADAAQKELARIDEAVAKAVAEKQGAFDRHMNAREAAIKAREENYERAVKALEASKEAVERDRQYVARIRMENEAKARTLAHVPLPEAMHQFDVMLPPDPVKRGSGRSPKHDIFS